MGPLEFDVRADGTRSSVLVERGSGVQIVECRSDGLERSRSIHVDRPLSGDQLGNVKDIGSLQNAALQRTSYVARLLQGGRRVDREMTCKATDRSRQLLLV